MCLQALLILPAAWGLFLTPQTRNSINRLAKVSGKLLLDAHLTTSTRTLQRSELGGLSVRSDFNATNFIKLVVSYRYPNVSELPPTENKLFSEQILDELREMIDGLNDDTLPLNVITRNLVLSKLYADLLSDDKVDPGFDFSLSGQSVGGNVPRNFDATYLMGLHMEILHTQGRTSADEIRATLYQHPLVEDVWLDEVLEGQKSNNLRAHSFGKIYTDDDVVEDPIYEVYDTTAAFKGLPMVYQTYTKESVETFVPATNSNEDRYVAFETPFPDLHFNDKYFKYQWAHNQNFGLRSQEGWQQWTGLNSDYVVALIDSGVDIDHPDLRSQYWRNQGEVDCFNGIDDDENGYVDDCIGWDFIDHDNLPQDENGHGTASAGIIAGVPNNGIGVVGVCWGCKLMILRTLDKDIRGTISGFIKAIDYALLHGAKVSNNSYGGRGSSYASLLTAVKRARAEGMIFVAAAGNYGSDNDLSFALPTYPASYNESNIISVAASDKNGALASFSCYGRRSVDLAAPGVGVFSTTLNKRYAQVDGTSFATPFVTGVAALILSREPYLQFQEVLRRIMDSVTPIPALRDRLKSGGILNMVGALSASFDTHPSFPRKTCTPGVCPAHSDCLVTLNGVRCRCHNKFKHMSGKCITKCHADTDCSGDEFCNTVGICDCKSGFTRDFEGCFDQNECIHRDICPRESICVNAAGGFDCLCPDGFLWNGIPWIKNGASCQVMPEVTVRSSDCRTDGCTYGNCIDRRLNGFFECLCMDYSNPTEDGCQTNEFEMLTLEDEIPPRELLHREHEQLLRSIYSRAESVVTQDTLGRPIPKKRQKRKTTVTKRTMHN